MGPEINGVVHRPMSRLCDRRAIGLGGRLADNINMHHVLIALDNQDFLGVSGQMEATAD